MEKKKLVLPESLKELSDWNGKEINHEQQVHLHNHELGEWIQVVEEESEFEKWHKTVEGGTLYSTKHHRKEGWQASEKNTRELYKPLIELVERYNDRSNGFMQEMFEKELIKIKALTGNV